MNAVPARRSETVLFTLGYEQSELPDYLRRLREHGVTRVVDVRAVPLSRKRGFSKNKLCEALAAIGIGYEHLKTLGAPNDLREARRAGGSWADYATGYAAQVLAHRGEDIAHLIELTRHERPCLLCFERDPAACHRSLVAEAVLHRSGAESLSVEHIRY